MNQSTSPNPRILILGAGPTGLGAAYRLLELGHTNFLMVDRHPYLGGLAHSFTDPRGFTWDIGGHVMFSHYDYYDRLFDRLMGDHYTLNNRESWVRIAGTWVPYPFQNNIRYLPKHLAYECIAGVIKAQTVAGGVRQAIARAANFAEFCHAVFGQGICRHFMDPYNFKVWAHPLDSMNKAWIGERVAVIDIDRALRNLVLGLDDYGWGPNNKFKFPLTGGTGEFYNRFGPVLKGHYNLSRNAVAIKVAEKQIHFSDGSVESYDLLLSTIPIDRLVNNVIVGQVPDHIRNHAAALKHSSGHMVGIGLRRDGGTPSTKCWMYFPEPNCPFYRVTYLSNYSPHMTPDKDRYFSLLCETSASEHKPVNPHTIVEDTIQGLINAGLLEPEDRDAIVSTWHYHADYSYPVPSVERDDILAQVIPWLEQQHIYSRGRFGMWKYEVSNTDHSLMQGVELVNRLLLGEPEHTIGIVYKVTDDGMQHATHSRPAVAGSGEKRLATPAAVQPAPSAAPEVVVRPAPVPTPTPTPTPAAARRSAH